MIWRIERVVTDDTTTFRPSGPNRAVHFEKPKAALESDTADSALDLEDINIIDVDVVRVLQEQALRLRCLVAYLLEKNEQLRQLVCRKS